MTTIRDYFNHEHYRAVRKFRKEKGFSVPSLNISLPNHHLVGKKLVNKEDSKEYTIRSVNKHWYDGWHVVVLVIDSIGSSRLLCWENINCYDSIIRERIVNVRKIFKVI